MGLGKLQNLFETTFVINGWLHSLNKTEPAFFVVGTPKEGHPRNRQLCTIASDSSERSLEQNP